MERARAQAAALGIARSELYPTLVAVALSETNGYDVGAQADPVWSPDGQSIAFGGQGGGAPTTTRILRMNTHQIEPVPGSDGLFSPRWSPNGRYLVGMRGDSTGLSLFDFKTQKWTMLVPGIVGYPCWSHDGRYLYFQRLGDKSDVVRAAVPIGKVEPVVSLKGFQQTGLNNFWLGLTPDDSVLVPKDAGTQEIVCTAWSSPHCYALHWVVIPSTPTCIRSPQSCPAVFPNDIPRDRYAWSALPGNCGRVLALHRTTIQIAV